MTKKHNFPAYLTEGNVIFLSPYTRLVDSELVAWYNVRVTDFLTTFPDFFENSMFYTDNVESSTFLKEIHGIWSEIIKRRVQYTIVDTLYLKYTEQPELVEQK
jgi:hypothetical protein